MQDLKDLFPSDKNYPYGVTGREAYLTGEEDDDFYDPEMERMMEQGALVMKFWEGAEQRRRTWQMHRLYLRQRLYRLHPAGSREA